MLSRLSPRDSATLRCPMASGDTARLYHALTSYARDREALPEDPRIVSGFVPDDFARWPAPCKAYPDGLPVVALPRTWPLRGRERHRRARRPARPGAGRRSAFPRSPGCCTCRPASCASPSAGQPDAAAPRGRLGRRALPARALRLRPRRGGLPDGVHWYDPVGHALLQVGPPAAGEATTLVVTGVPGAPAGATRSAASATSTGTRARCSPRRSRWPSSAGLEPAAVDALPGRPGHAARGRRRRARVPGRARRRSGTGRRRSSRAARRRRAPSTRRRSSSRCHARPARRRRRRARRAVAGRSAAREASRRVCATSTR